MSEPRRLVVALSAEESAGVQLLRVLVSGPFDVPFVLTTKPAGEARGATVWHLASSSGIETLPAREVRRPALASRLRDAGVDLLLNVHSLHVIHDAVLDAPVIGAFNLHPGPLPRYAGLNAPSHAIANGEGEHGVTLHWMDAGIDTGDVAWQTRFEIGETETGLALSARCIREGIALLKTLLDVAARDPSAIPRHKQDPGERSYFGRGVPHGGRLAWGRPARALYDFVRAADFHPLSSPWGTPAARLDGEPLGVVRAAPPLGPADAPPGTVSSGMGDAPAVACGDAWLPLLLVRSAGQVRNAKDVLGAGMRLGDGEPPERAVR